MTKSAEKWRAEIFKNYGNEIKTAKRKAFEVHRNVMNFRPTYGAFVPNAKCSKDINFVGTSFTAI
jgi:hypothetical protein